MKKIVLSLLILSFASACQAQKEDFQWIFNWVNLSDCSHPINTWGDKCGASIIDFNVDPPKVSHLLGYTLDYRVTNLSLIHISEPTRPY